MPISGRPVPVMISMYSMHLRFVTTCSVESSVNAYYRINGNVYDSPYFLADGIYPNVAWLQGPIHAPSNEDESIFTVAQEAIRKDMERVFGVLQARFAIIRYPALRWNRETLGKIMRACIIMHNMIVESERHLYRTHTPCEYETLDEMGCVRRRRPDDSLCAYIAGARVLISQVDQRESV
jgi:hypothetical protein